MSEENIPTKEVHSINIEDEMQNSYMDYAMSVIVGRALPNIRDGLKPVHRRILYAMFKEGLLSSKRYSKCAGVVGEVLKKYHPHGDSAVYDALVRMAQPWNMRYPLIDGQGNFGSIDGDSAAAYRYTESRLTKLAEELMADIEKETVDFVPNFDGSHYEPYVLPSKVPNLLINGSDGIAVGMATKIPPHNLTEISNALIKLIDSPDATLQDMLQIVKGPDFPTAGEIHGRGGILKAFSTGRGKVIMRGKYDIEPFGKDREKIVFTEIPYQANKAKIIESIADLVNQGKIEGISDLRDESDRQGMRVVIELKKNVNANIILNLLFKHTQLQSSFGIIMLNIIDGKPRITNLLQMLQHFLKHRKEIIIRRTQYELREAEKRAHILEGLKIAVENIDEVIQLIKSSKNPEEARTSLISRFQLSTIQAQAILDMRLQKLTGLERDKIIEEYNEILAKIERLKEILGSEKLIFGIIKDEIVYIRDKFGDERRTVILDSAIDSMDIQDLIQKEDMIVTFSHLGYIKRTPTNSYRSQKRGGKGLQGMNTRDEDFVTDIFSATTHDHVLVFSNFGKIYWLKVYNIPEGSRTTKGKSIKNLIQLDGEEKATAILPILEFEKDKFVMFVTKKGTVKKTSLESFSKPRAGGIIAITLKDDELVQVKITDGSQDVIISTSEGKAIRFNEKDIRAMGRSASGVRGISLNQDNTVVSMDVISPDEKLLTVSSRGYGKRTEVDEYRSQTRGGSGILTMKTTEKTGKVVCSQLVKESDDLMLVTDAGQMIRQNVGAISVIGRNTQGVRLFNVGPDENVVSAAIIESEETEETMKTTEANEATENTETVETKASEESKE